MKMLVFRSDEFRRPNSLWGWWPILFALLVSTMLIVIAIRTPPFPVYEYRNVSVLKQLGPNQWLMSKDDGEFLYTGCPDFPNDSVIWVGYVAKKAVWEEQGACKSIFRPDTGFWWDRDSQGNVKEVQYVTNGAAR
jgi:hypothetical protein